MTSNLYRLIEQYPISDGKIFFLKAYIHLSYKFTKEKSFHIKFYRDGFLYAFTLLKCYIASFCENFSNSC